MSCTSVLIAVVFVMATTSAQLPKVYQATAKSVKMGPKNMANDILKYEYLLDKDTQQITGSMEVLAETEPIRYTVTTMEEIAGKWVLLNQPPFTISGLMSELQDPFLSAWTCAGQLQLNDQGGFLPGACSMTAETMDTKMHSMEQTGFLPRSTRLNLTVDLFGSSVDLFDVHAEWDIAINTDL